MNQKLNAFQHTLWLGPTCWLEPGKHFLQSQTVIHILWASKVSASGSGKGLEWPVCTWVLPFLEGLLSPKAVLGVCVGGTTSFLVKAIFQGKVGLCPEKGEGGYLSPSLCWSTSFQE